MGNHSIAIEQLHKAWERIAALEAALRDLVDYTDITKHVDADAVTERVKRARVVLGLTVETEGELCPHGFVLAEMVCGPCSEGRPNKHEG